MKNQNNSIASLLLCVLLIFAMAFIVPLGALAADGDLDSSFDGDGKVTTDFTADDSGTDSDTASDAAIQGDGKIVVVGHVFAGTTAAGTQLRQPALIRYNADGSLDPSFGTGGKAIVPTRSGERTIANAVVVQSDGKVVTAGRIETAFGDFTGYLIARHNQDGSPDTLFGNDGIVRVITPVFINDLAIQQDGKIVAAGNAIGATSDFAVLRFNSNGTPDTSFSDDGIAFTDFVGGADVAHGVAVQADGKIVAVGERFLSSKLVFAAARYNTDGAPDMSFGPNNNGRTFTEFNLNSAARAVALQSDGKIVMAGFVAEDFALVRYNTNGSADLSFGINSNGAAITDFGTPDDEALDVAVQSDGKIVAAGRSNSGTSANFGLTRYNPNGTLDTTFSDDGKVLTDFAGGFDRAVAVAVHESRIIAAGTATNSFPTATDFAVARYLNTGPTPPTPTPTPTPLQISPSSSTVPTGGTVNLTASGGTVPYVFSVVNQNPSGTVDTSTGVYTAGATPGVDTVRVTDANNATADATITVTAACVANQKTWDGGGSTNNWSESANWTCDAVPLSSDTVIFNGTSTKNSTIDTSRTILNLQINTGYSGTITIGGTAVTLTLSQGQQSAQADGVFDCGTGAVAISNATFTQTGGQFNCQSGSITNTSFFRLNVNGGTFNAPTGTMVFGGGSVFALGAGGTFNHNNGTIVASGGSFPLQIINGLAATLEVHNFTLDLDPNSGALSFNEPGDKLRVLGTLNLVRGNTQGTIEAQGAVNVSSTYGNGNDIGSGKLLITGPAARTITLPGLVTNAFYNRIELNAPAVTMNAGGEALVKLRTLDLIAGTFNAGATPVTLGLVASFTNSSQTGGTFNCGTAAISLSAVNFTQTGGQFNCQNGTIENSPLFRPTINGGTFNAPSGTLTFGGGSILTIGAGGTFNHNNGTIIFSGGNSGLEITTGTPAALDVYNLKLDIIPNNLLNFTAGKKLRVLGTLDLFGGNIGGTIEAHGAVNVSSTFGTDNGIGNFIFGGGNDQIYTNAGGANLRGAWTLDKTGGTVILASDLDLSNGFGLPNLNLTNGTITTGPFTVNAGLRPITRANGYINGNLRRTFNSSGPRTFDVGTENGFSPVTVNVTSLQANPSALAISAKQGAHPQVDPAISLGRFWSMNEFGDLTATLAFSYLETDVNGNEAAYRVNRITNGNLEIFSSPTATIDTSANTATVTGISDFSDWTLAAPAPLQIAPATASVDLGNQISFTATGGTAPYVFTLAGNNSGASIDAATGVYTAGAAPGVDTVRVTDANSLTANATVTVTAPCVSEQKTWDGGGATGNWSEAANWTCDSVPLPTDTVIFNGTNSKNVSIDLGSTVVGGFLINEGYTGTISKSGASLTVNGPFNQTSGTFAGGQGDIDINGNFLHLGGSFIASSGSNFFSGGQFVISGNPPFDHNGGTIVFDGGSSDSFINAATTFNNFTVNKNDGDFFTILNNKITVLGTLTLANGRFAGGEPIEARGAINYSAGFDGGAGSLNILSGVQPRTITFDAGVDLLRQITLDAADVTINTSGEGTLVWSIFRLHHGTVNQASTVAFVFTDSDTNGVSYLQSGGTFNGSSASVTTEDFLFAGGAFNGGSGDIDINGYANLSGGTFTASSGSTYISGPLTFASPGVFNHNGGTIVFDGATTDNFINAPMTLNNFTVNKNNNESFTVYGEKISVTGTLAMNDGKYVFGTLGIEAHGPVSVGANFDGGPGLLTFGGAAAQTFINNGGQNLNGVWAIDKPNGTVTLASDLDLSSGTSDLNLTAGTITTGDFTLNAGMRNVERVAGHINGKLRQNFNIIGERMYHVGTDNGYSPVQVNVTAFSGSAPGLTVGATQGVHPSLNPNVSLARYWTVAEHDSVTANLTFEYLDPTDIINASTGVETAYRAAKLDTAVNFFTETQVPIDRVGNRFAVNDISDFATWTLSVPQLFISPAITSVPVQGTRTFTASGGTAPYNFNLAGNNSGGSIDPATGEYTAGATANVQDTVGVMDAEGRFANATINVTAGAAYKLGFIVQPNDTPLGAAISPPVQVAVQDQFGNTVTNSADTIALAIGNNPSGSSLSGTLTRAAINGVAVFDDLSISNFGNGYTLFATSGSLASVTSNSFNVVNQLVVTNTNDSGSGSLRQAILNANSEPGMQTITFNIPGSSPFVIAPLTQLPATTDSVMIDATTQPGFGSSPIVAISGINLPATTTKIGLAINGGNSTVKGLSVFGFTGSFSSAILLGSNGNVIQGNYVGLDPAGLPQANTIGLDIASGSNLIGGAAAGERNIIAGNTFGVLLRFSDASSQGANNIVQGNFIGTDPSGSISRGNTTGILVLAANKSTIKDNLISGNAATGIEIGGAADAPPMGNVIQDNLIGLKSDGTNPLPNGAEAIYLKNQTATGNKLTGNLISTNGALGIKLNSGRTGNTGLINDPKDPDTGTNQLQNYPVLISAVPSGGGTTITGTLNSTPSSTFTLEFFSSASCDPTGWGDGEVFLGSSSVTTDAGGIAGFATELPVVVASGRQITATATDAEGNTSEFSQCRVANAIHTISGRLTSSGLPLANTEVRISGGQTARTLTNSNGEYSFSNLPSGGSFTITPVKPEYTFTPASRSFTGLSAAQSGQNFSGTQMTYSISGRVRVMSGGKLLPLKEATITLSGAGSRTARTNTSGDYLFKSLPNGNYTVTAVRQNYTFTAPSINVTINGSKELVDFTGQATTPLAGRIVIGDNGLLKGMNADGSGLVTLINQTSSQPNFSPDGRRLAFNRDSNLWVSNSDGSNQTMLTNSPETYEWDPAWSPDGSRIAFMQAPYPFNGRSELFIMNADGTNQMRVPFAPNGAGYVRNPTWSPDGSKIAFYYSTNTTAGIFVTNTNGSNLTQLSTSGVGFPDWSPDGAKIIFTRSNALFTMNADGSGQTQVINNNESSISGADWSPDGLRFSFSRRNSTTGIYEMVVADANGGNQVILSSSDFLVTPDWGIEPTAATPAGTDVTVQTGATSVSFSTVTEAGETTVVPIPPTSAGTIPGGFVVGSFGAYEITTTATITPPITVCFTVPTTTTLTQFNNLKIMHNEGGTLVDRTSSRDFQNRRICATVNSLSPFVIAEEIDPNLPSLTGLVLDSNGEPMSDVHVKLTGTEERTTITDIDGLFTFPNLTPGGNYNVQPKQIGYLFDEYGQDFVNLDGEATTLFVGTTASFQIGGRVTDAEGNGVAGVQINLDRATTNTQFTDADGNYLFTNLPADGFYEFTPRDPRFIFTPSIAQITNLTGDTSGVDFVTTAAPPNPTPTPTPTPTPMPTPTPTPSPSPAAFRCPRSHGYWRNNPNIWPVSSLTLGAQTYSTAELVTILSSQAGSDASLTLARQLIAAKLSIANGSDSAPLGATLTEADYLLAAFAGKLPYRVRPSSVAGRNMTAAADLLHSYNSGSLTPVCSP